MSSLKNIFNPSKNEYTDIFERTRYLMSYRITLFLSIALFVLDIILLAYFSLGNVLMVSIGLTAAVICFFYIRITGKYKTFILGFNLIGAFLCIFTLFYINDQPRIVDGLWMVVSSMFTFFTVGKKWGAIITAIHGVVLTTFFLFFFNDQIALLKTLSQIQVSAFSSNILICFSIFFYLNWQNIKTAQEAQDEINKTKEFLVDQIDVINKQNDEKTVLLKEIHHRVKNNLQVIVSLLRLQSRDIQHIEEAAKFDESINRVMAMSLIHEKIYQTENFSHINLEDYFKTLANDMIRTVQVGKKIELDINCKVDNLGLKPVVPIALIFNELLSNSIKYAFEKTEHPKITVNMNEHIKNFVEFTYSDNGTWKEARRENSFGLELIDTLSEQLNGHFELYKSNGTKYQFYFEKIDS
ncbi:MAG: sensor histidine kinase [Bacteroidota bacterium]